AADQCPAGKCQLGHRLPAAFVDRPGAISYPAPAFDDPADRRVMLPALEFLEGADVRIGIVERRDEPERHLAIRLVIEKSAPPAVALRERPALRVDHPSRLMPVARNLP